MEKVLGPESVWVCCFFLSLSFLIWKDQKLYPLITYTLSQARDAGELERHQMKAKHGTELSIPMLFFLECCWFPCIYGSSGLVVFMVYSPLICLKCWVWIREISMGNNINFSSTCKIIHLIKGTGRVFGPLLMVDCMSCQCNVHDHITYQIRLQ